MVLFASDLPAKWDTFECGAHTDALMVHMWEVLAQLLVGLDGIADAGRVTALWRVYWALVSNIESVVEDSHGTFAQIVVGMYNADEEVAYGTASA